MGKLAVGIDLGTTYSCVAVFRDGKVEIIPNNMGNRVMPSYVAFCSNNEVKIGEPAKYQVRIDPANTVFDTKRLIGRSFYDAAVQNDIKFWPFKVVGVEGAPKIEVTVDGVKQLLRPEEISAKILRQLKETAEYYLQNEVKDAVITVPAYFDNIQRQATIQAAKIAGLNVLALINEPTAAAIAYGLDKKEQIKKHVLIYDIGGGTLDVSILKIGDSRFEVKATTGDGHLGGQDFDNCLLTHLVEDFKAKHKVTLNVRSMRRLRSECERAKHILSFADQANIEIDCLHGDIDYVKTISRERFEDLNEELFIKAADAVHKVLRDANMSSVEIEEVVLIGGSSRIPKIQELLKGIFNDRTFVKNINPDEAVAYGAAIHAAHLSCSGLQLYKLIEVTPLSLGVSIVGGLMSVVVERNTQIPCHKTGSYTTVSDDQYAIRFNVYEGERPLIKDNRRLGDFLLSGIPRAPRGVPDVKAIFNIDKNGILKVSAIEQETGKSETIKIDYGKVILNDLEVGMKIKQAQKFEAIDRAEKERIQAKLKVEDFIYKLNRIMKNPDLFDQLLSGEKKTLEDKTKNAELFLENNDVGSKDAFQEKLVDLENQFNRILRRFD